MVPPWPRRSRRIGALQLRHGGRRPTPRWHHLRELPRGQPPLRLHPLHVHLRLLDLPPAAQGHPWADKATEAPQRRPTSPRLATQAPHEANRARPALGGRCGVRRTAPGARLHDVRHRQSDGRQPRTSAGGAQLHETSVTIPTLGLTARYRVAAARCGAFKSGVLPLGRPPIEVS